MIKTALIIIDVQDSFLHMPYWSDLGFDVYIDRLNRLIQYGRNEEWSIIHILHEGKNGPFDPASGYVKTMSKVSRKPQDKEFRKRIHNALTDSGLDGWLRSQEIKRLIIAGLRTEQCCETTARIASDLGYEVVFVTDATHTFPMRHKTSGRLFEVEEIQQKTELVLEERFARTTRVEDIIAQPA